jgi:NADH dehydrogenase FAD-containing subunit
VLQINKESRILSNFLNEKVATNSLAELKQRNVKVIVNAKIDSVTTLPDGKTELALSNGDKVVTDFYLPAVGLEANSSFMPKNLLNDRGEIMVDEFMAVKGVKDIWSCGDVADIQTNKVFYASQQAPVLAANIHASLTSKPTTPYKPNNKPMGAVTVGRNKGFGAFGNWSLPGFFIYHMKVKTMMVENLPKTIAGTA